MLSVMSKFIDSKNKKSFFQRLCKTLLSGDSSASRVDGQDDSNAADEGHAVGSNDSLIRVRIEPASAATKSQSLLGARIIEESVFIIGRKSGNMGHDSGGVDFSIRQVEPYTVSRRHCAIERFSDHVVVRDLGGKFGLLVNNERLRGQPDAVASIKLTKGVHGLILGSRESVMCFNLIIE